MADMEAQVAQALPTELERQSEASKTLVVSEAEGGPTVNGVVDLEALAMAAVGAVAGGPWAWALDRRLRLRRGRPMRPAQVAELDTLAPAVGPPAVTFASQASDELPDPAQHTYPPSGARSAGRP